MKFWYERGAWVAKKARQQFADLKPEQVKSIAVIRHAALGDMVLVRAFLAEARRFFPNASITLSVSSNYRYGAPEDMVDRLHVAVGSDKRDTPWREQLQVIKAFGYHDIVFDMTVSARSIYLCLLNKAGLKVGYPYRDWQRIFYDAVVLRSDHKFEAEVMLDMLNLLGAKTRYPPDFQLPVTPVHAERPYLVYFVTASVDYKCWPLERYSQLIRMLATAYPQYDHVVLEGTATWERVDSLMAQLQDLGNVRMHKAMPLPEASAFLKGASVVIGNDTGVRNLAITCEAPTVGIFFATVPFRYWPRYGLHDVVFNPDGSLPAVEQVYASIVNLLARVTT